MTIPADSLSEQRTRTKAYQLWEAAGRPDGRSDEFWRLAEAAIGEEEARYDEALRESFPASDPPEH
ncbi:MAG TPA: DUF2934 domain-containing protein [Rhodopila sp.]